MYNMVPSFESAGAQLMATLVTVASLLIDRGIRGVVLFPVEDSTRNRAPELVGRLTNNYTAREIRDEELIARECRPDCRQKGRPGHLIFCRLRPHFLAGSAVVSLDAESSRGLHRYDHRVCGRNQWRSVMNEDFSLGRR